MDNYTQIFLVETRRDGEKRERETDSGQTVDPGDTGYPGSPAVLVDCRQLPGESSGHDVTCGLVRISACAICVCRSRIIRAWVLPRARGVHDGMLVPDGFMGVFLPRPSWNSSRSLSAFASRTSANTSGHLAREQGVFSREIERDARLTFPPLDWIVISQEQTRGSPSIALRDAIMQQKAR